MIVPFFTAAANALSSSMSISSANFRNAFNSSRRMLSWSLLAKPQTKNAFEASTEKQDAPKSTRLTLTRPSQALLDHTATKVGIDQPTFGAPDGFAEFLIGDPFTAREADKWLGHENAHPAPRATNYNT
jgi:hypothetical protein